MKTVGIIVKPQMPEIKPVLQDVVDWLRRHDKDVVLGPRSAGLIGEPTSYDDTHLQTLPEMILVLGGDGTMLSAARLVEEQAIPILGVNMGGLGFLTETTIEYLYPSLEKVFSNAFYLDTRLRIGTRITHHNKDQVFQGTALNDVVVSKGPVGRMINIQIHVDGKFMTNLRGDGVIFSTPTGSTAYSLSAGGPILHPSLDALNISPISPHTLTHRPLLVPGKVKLEANLTSQDTALVTLDGQVGIEIQSGDILTASASPHRTNLIRFPDRTFFDVLRNKLKWGDG